MSFVGLHNHSDYSLLDGASQLPNLVDRAVNLGMPAIALTDHGVMYGAIDLLKVCSAKGIKPIIGNEMYVINGDITKQERRPRYHQVVLAKNTQGYKNLVKLTTLSHLQGVQGKGIFSRPCINKELIAEYHEGLIVTSGCRAGEVPQAILQGKPEIARRVAQWYKDLFGADYYLEIQDHGYPEDRIVNVELVQIARELEIQIIATNDSHFTACSDVEAHDALLCIQTGKLIVEENRLRYSGTEYLKSAEEMRLLFRDHLTEDVIEEAIATTLEVAEKVATYDILGAPRIPDYPVPEGYTLSSYMEEVTRQGLMERFNCASYDDIDSTYRDRLDYEMQMMHRMGFDAYFLVVWDYIKFARDNGIPVGPGRGSAAGSLVAYALRITNIDPVHHGLLFERFLNPERKSMPDIDTDFCIDRRDEVIQYVTQKYGADRVAQIITYNRMTSKAVLKDVARVLDIPYAESDRMAKMIPVVRGKPTKLKVMISEQTPAPEFKEKYDNDPKVNHWLDMAMRIEGTNKSVGIHAAGVVISAQPLDEVVPLQRNADGAVFTQYFMEDIESLGLLKMDFLGLKNLTMIQKALDLIQHTRQETIDLDRLPLDDPNSYALLAKGELEGIFQLESSGMRQIVRELKPSSLEDISSVLALYRPGPLDAGLIPLFINRKHGREKIEYQHPLLEPILQETYGVLCLPKGTPINRPDGSTVPIETIQAGDVILTSDGRSVRPATVAKQWQSGIKKILKITLSSGTVIFSSPDHRFLTAVGDKTAKQLKSVSTLKNAHFYGDVLYEQWAVGSESTQLRDNEAYLLGLLIGDGDLAASTPNIACSTEECARWVSTLMARTWGGEPRYYFNTRCWYAYCKFNTQPYRSPLTIFLDTLYGDRSWKVRSTRKRLPANILDYCERDRINLLRGLWDSDGCYSQRLTYFRSSSPQLLNQVGSLLSSLKIVYHIAKNYVYVADVTRFQCLLGETQLPNKLQNQLTDHQYLPIPSREFDLALTQSIAKTDSTTRKIVRQSLQRSTLFKPKQSNYSQNLDRWDELYQQIYEATYLQDVRPVYVVAVDPADEAECFDIQMADQSSPYFLANGVVTHNCYQEQIMRMAQDLAGYSLGQADLLRRAMGKKKPEEMKKHQAIFVDGSAKNGIKATIAEELFDQMLKFAEYCFNKSHSTAYGYVTYQTAYLKANYPVEYMAALLTANSGDQDKVQRYIVTCTSMGITVEPPDINRSGIDFTPLQDSILFGLSAVRNVGSGAIEHILSARDAEGPFKSLADLCDRIDPRTVNRRSLEALIQCGAMDCIDLNRNQLIADLDLVLDWAQSRARDRAVGQGSLFDMLGGDSNLGSSGFESAPKAPPVPDYPPQEKLKLEKELLGFYVSDHPLKVVQQAAKVLAPISLGDLEHQAESVLLSAVVMVSSLKPIVTKKGDRMAVLQIEDLTGQADAVVFPKTFERIGQYLQVDTRLMLWGKADRRDDRVQFVIDDAEPIEAVRMVMVELDPQIAADITKQHRLRTILLEQRNGEEQGKVPVIAIVTGGDRREVVRLGAQFRVADHQIAVKALQQAGFQARCSSLTSA